MNQPEQVLQKKTTNNDTDQIQKQNQPNYYDDSQIYSQYADPEYQRYRNFRYNQLINQHYFPQEQQYYLSAEQEYYYHLEQQYYYRYHQDTPYYQYHPYYHPQQYDYYTQRQMYLQNALNNIIKQEYEPNGNLQEQEQQKISNSVLEKLKIEAIKNEEPEYNGQKESDKEDNNQLKNSQETQNDQNNVQKDSSNSATISTLLVNVKTEEVNMAIKQEETIVGIENIEPEKPLEQENQQQEKQHKTSSQNKKQQINGLAQKSKQSISKNNIRNFLTPIVRMKASTIDYKLLEKENITSKDFLTFLKKYFYMQDQTKLNIRQTVFDSLLNSKDKNDIKEKKVFATIALQNFQTQFLKLLLEKKSNLKNEEFYQQFEWINCINDSLVSFLNSIEEKI